MYVIIVYPNEKTAQIIPTYVPVDWLIDWLIAGIDTKRVFCNLLKLVWL